MASVTMVWVMSFLAMGPRRACQDSESSVTLSGLLARVRMFVSVCVCVTMYMPQHFSFKNNCYILITHEKVLIHFKMFLRCMYGISASSNRNYLLFISRFIFAAVDRREYYSVITGLHCIERDSH